MPNCSVIRFKIIRYPLHFRRLFCFLLLISSTSNCVEKAHLFFVLTVLSRVMFKKIKCLLNDQMNLLNPLVLIWSGVSHCILEVSVPEMASWGLGACSDCFPFCCWIAELPMKSPSVLFTFLQNYGLSALIDSFDRLSPSTVVSSDGVWHFWSFFLWRCFDCATQDFQIVALRCPWPWPHTAVRPLLFWRPDYITNTNYL